MNNYQTINQSELDDFNNSCQRENIDPNDFILNEHDVNPPPVGSGAFYISGKLTISKNGKSKTYASGHGSKWPAEFDIDLIAGFFN